MFPHRRLARFSVGGFSSLGTKSTCFYVFNFEIISGGKPKTSMRSFPFQWPSYTKALGFTTYVLSSYVPFMHLRLCVVLQLLPSPPCPRVTRRWGYSEAISFARFFFLCQTYRYCRGPLSTHNKWPELLHQIPDSFPPTWHAERRSLKIPKSRIVTRRFGMDAVSEQTNNEIHTRNHGDI